jgi:hypothetical protein
VTLGRANWTLAGNERGGQTDAPVYRPSATCNEHGPNLLEYLRDVLMHIGDKSNVREMSPYDWKAEWTPSSAAHRASVLVGQAPATKCRSVLQRAFERGWGCESPNGDETTSDAKPMESAGSVHSHPHPSRAATVPNRRTRGRTALRTPSCRQATTK